MARIPTLGWIFTESSLLSVAETILDDDHDDPCVEQIHPPMYRFRRSGVTNVVLSLFQQSNCTGDAATLVRDLVSNFPSLEAVLLSGYGDGTMRAGTRAGDLIIKSGVGQFDNGADPSWTDTLDVAQRAAWVLQREVGADGRWLVDDLSEASLTSPDLPRSASDSKVDKVKGPQLYYEGLTLGTKLLQPKGSPDKWEAEQNEDFDVLAEELTNLHIPVAVIVGINSDISASVLGVVEKDVAAYAVLYGREIIQIMKNPLTNSISGLEKTEIIVPPQVNCSLPPFKSHHYPSHGDAILLVIPTKNEFKKEILQEYFSGRAPSGTVIHTITLPVDSGVGSQPYNEAGMIGAHTRLTNSLNHLDSQEYQEIFKEKGIGTVIIACIESYIQTENIDRPTDFGVVVVHNATTQQTTVCTSQGVTVPPAYVNRARRFGYEGEPNHGIITVGQILAANVMGLDNANWQAVLGGHSRYDLLKAAIRQVSIPW